MAEIIIKNSARNDSKDIAEHKYVPQYRLLGINPEQRDCSKNNQATPTEVDFKMPNVGNTEETFWTSTFPDTNKEKIDEDIYFLIAKDKLVITGSLKEVQKKLEKIFYQDGEEKFDFTIDDVSVLKKMKIKIGVFVE